jgi:hypothetical protein
MTKKVSNNPVGGPTKWGTAKKRVNVTLTPTAIKGLDILAKEFKLSRSELVERVGRELLPVVEIKGENDLNKLKFLVTEKRSISAIVTDWVYEQLATLK